MESCKVMNGTWGQVWEDGVEVAEIIAFQVKVTHNFDPITMSRQMVEDRKLVGSRITGSMTIHKVFTRGDQDVADALQGLDRRKTLIGKLDDPDAYGAERVAVYGVSYDEDTVMDWTHAKTTPITVAFQATGIEHLDKAAVQ